MYIDPLLLAVVSAFAFVAIGLVVQSAIKYDPKAQATPYRKRLHLMSAAERRFFTALCEADDDTHWLFTKVRLVDLVATRKGLDKSARQTALNKIKAKHVDFVLCEPQTMEPVLAVELDHASHNAKPRQDRDAFVDAVYEAVGLPILHVRARAAYDSEALRREIGRLLPAASQPALGDKSPPDPTGEPQGGAAWLRSEQVPNRMSNTPPSNEKAPK